MLGLVSLRSVTVFDILMFPASFQDMMMFSSGIFWFGLLLIPLMTLLVDFVYKV